MTPEQKLGYIPQLMNDDIGGSLFATRRVRSFLCTENCKYSRPLGFDRRAERKAALSTSPTDSGYTARNASLGSRLNRFK